LDPDQFQHGALGPSSFNVVQSTLAIDATEDASPVVDGEVIEAVFEAQAHGRQSLLLGWAGAA
jgi:hypothetical protein